MSSGIRIDMELKLPKLLEEFNSLHTAVMDPNSGAVEHLHSYCDKWGMFLGSMNVIFTHTTTVT